MLTTSEQTEWRSAISLAPTVQDSSSASSRSCPTILGHPLNVRPQFRRRAAVGKHIDHRHQYRQRRPQFVCGIGGEVPLHLKTSLELIQRLINRLDEWQNFARQPGFR